MGRHRVFINALKRQKNDLPNTRPFHGVDKRREKFVDIGQLGRTNQQYTTDTGQGSVERSSVFKIERNGSISLYG